MKFVYQTVLHDPENGKHGNCLSAVLAGLLHLPIETVPVFKDTETWRKELNAWLLPYGLAYFSLTGPVAEMCERDGIRGMHYEAAGWSPRFKDAMHACIGLDGRVVFDPHPGGDGFDVEQIVEHSLLVCKEPWRMVEMAAMKELLVKQAILIGEFSKGLLPDDPMWEDVKEATQGLDALEVR